MRLEKFVSLWHSLDNKTPVVHSEQMFSFNPIIYHGLFILYKSNGELDRMGLFKKNVQYGLWWSNDISVYWL